MALLGAGLLIAVTRVTTETALQDVEWATLAFFMGLFIMVGGLVEAGVLEALATSIADFAGGNLLAFTGVLLWGSGLLSGIVDNIPYVASMSPVVADIIGSDGEPQVLWWALALGADLGGNATLVGASANIVVAGIAARNGTPIGFWQFTRHGLVIAGATLAVSTALRLAALFPARWLINGVGVLGRKHDLQQVRSGQQAANPSVLDHDQQRAAQPRHHRRALQDRRVPVDRRELHPTPRRQATGPRPVHRPGSPGTAALRRPRP